MKKLNHKLFVAAAALTAVLFTSCDQLQDSLGSEMRAKLEEETGTASIAEKNWYYNGTKNDDMSAAVQSYDSSIVVDFGKKVALNTLTGSIQFSYTDKNGDTVTKNITSLSGKFTDDYEGFKLNLNEVVKNFTPEENPSGNGVMNIKIGGFVCAEGDQNGRSIAAAEFRNIKIQPLFSTYSINFSTSGYSTVSKIEFPVNGDVALAKGRYQVTGKDSSENEYTFNVSAGYRCVVLSPVDGTAPDDGTEITVNLKDILVAGEGNAFSKEVKIKFIRNLIVVDGQIDSNYLKTPAASVADEEGDGSAFTWPFTESDFTGMYALNDDDYLYVAVKGSFASTYGNAVSILISKNHTEFNLLADSTVKAAYEIADTVAYGRDSLKNGKPDFFMYHKPQTPELGAWINKNSAAVDVASAITVGPSKNFTSASVIEYAIPMSTLSEAGIVSGDVIHLVGVLTANWDEGKAAADVVPSQAASFNDNHNNLTLNFKNGLEYTVQ